MEQLKAFLLDLDRSTLVDRLLATEYAFAWWRFPQESESSLIISLSGTSREGTEISTLDQGFVVSRFDENRPQHIAADLVLQENSITIDPRINDEQLDQLTNDLKSIAKKQVAIEEKGTNEPATEFESKIREAVDAIVEGSFEKVVLSRYLDVELPDNFSGASFFQNLCETYDNAFVSLVRLPGSGTWLGASPELLLSDNAQRFKTAALAGTKALTGEEALSEIAWTQKEIEEQAFVSRFIINCFKKIRLREFEEYGPKTVKAGNLAHLKTEFSVNYKEVQFEGLADQMLNLLHPTSAVCGMPMEEAKSFILSHEGYDRELYAGYLGPVNFKGSTDIFVNLRCMQIHGEAARLYAGAGVTEGSVPEKELIETELKMQTLSRLI